MERSWFQITELHHIKKDGGGRGRTHTPFWADHNNVRI